MPCDAPKATVASLPNTRAATWFTDSHSTGLTLPGMIDEPACSSGSSSSASPADGPLDSRRMSLAIFVSATASPRRPADASARAPWPPCCTIGLAARAQRQPRLGGEGRDDGRRERGRCVDARADGRPAERQLAEHVDVGSRADERAGEQPGPRVGLLAEGDGCGVHEVRAAGLDDVGEPRSDMSRNASISSSTAGCTSATSRRATPMRMAVGTVSFDDCDALTWSFGCTATPRASDARVATTSLTFMFVDVPEPVW